MEAGIVKAARVVDHIIPINPDDPYDTQDGKFGEPLDEDNCRSLCDECHNRKSGRDGHVKTK